jgi:hypothetical protein
LEPTAAGQVSVLPSSSLAFSACLIHAGRQVSIFTFHTHQFLLSNFASAGQATTPRKNNRLIRMNGAILLIAVHRCLNSCAEPSVGCLERGGACGNVVVAFFVLCVVDCVFGQSRRAVDWTKKRASHPRLL